MAGVDITFLRELADLLYDLIWGSFEPGWRIARVGNCAGRNAFAVAVKTTHGCWLPIERGMLVIGLGSSA